jgi:hypothetical protein
MILSASGNEFERNYASINIPLKSCPNSKKRLELIKGNPHDQHIIKQINSSNGKFHPLPNSNNLNNEEYYVRGRQKIVVQGEYPRTARDQEIISLGNGLLGPNSDR